MAIGKEVSPASSSRHFVLIHGAWCWYKLVPLLQNAGHKVTALDLSTSGTNPKQVNDLHTIDDYHQPLYSYLEALLPEDKVILVGHSMGGFGVSCAMERFPEKIAFAVFASAYMLGPDLSIDKLAQKFNPGIEYYQDSHYTTDGKPGDPPLTILFGPKYIANSMYQQSGPEDVALAFLSMRWTKFFNDPESRRQLLVTKEKFGRIPRAFLVGGDDKGIPAEFQRWMIQNNPPDVYEVIEGADHIVMMSKPHELCYYLVGIALNQKIHLSIGPRKPKSAHSTR